MTNPQTLPRKPGRPRGTFKHALPIDQFQKLKAANHATMELKRLLVNEAIERLNLACKIDNAQHLALFRLTKLKALKELQKDQRTARPASESPEPAQEEVFHGD